MTKKTMLTVQVDKDLRSKLGELAKKRQCSLSLVARDALEFSANFNPTTIEKIITLAKQLKTDHIKVAETIISNRLAQINAEEYYQGPGRYPPVLDEFIFEPSGELIPAKKLYEKMFSKRRMELERKDEEQLSKLKDLGIELHEYQKAFLNRHKDPETWKRFSKQEQDNSK